MKQITDMKSYSKGFEHGKKAEWFKLVNTFIEYNFWVIYDLDIIFGEENKNPDLFLDKLTELENYSSNHIKDKNNMDDNYKYGYEEGIKKCKAEVAICLMNIFDSPELSKSCEKKVESELDFISKYADIPKNEVKILKNKKNRISTLIEKTKEKKCFIQLDREREKRKANLFLYSLKDSGAFVIPIVIYFIVFILFFDISFTLRFIYIPIILGIVYIASIFLIHDIIKILCLHFLIIFIITACRYVLEYKFGFHFWILLC